MSLTISDDEWDDEPISEAKADDMLNADPWSGLQVSEPTAAESFGMGVKDVGQGVMQAYLRATDAVDEKRYSREKTRERETYEGRRGADAGFDWPRAGGQIAAGLPATLLTKKPTTFLGKLLTSAIEGGVLGGALFTNEGDSKTSQILVGAGAGALAPVALTGVAAAAPMVKRTMIDPVFKRGSAQRQMPDASPQTVANAQEQILGTGQIDPEALARAERLDEMGFQGEAAPMPGQVSRDPATWTAERNLQKVDGAGALITQRLRNQDAKFGDIFEELHAATGRNIDDVVDAGESINEAVTARWKSTQRAVGRLYKRADREFGGVDGVTLNNFRSVVDELSDEDVGGRLATVVNNRLKRMGIIDENGGSTGKTLTITEAETLRKWISRQTISGATPAETRRLTSEMVESMDDEVFELIGDEGYKGARAAASQRFDEFGANIANKIIKDKVDGADAIRNIVNKYPAKDLIELKRTLLKAPNGSQAWNDLRGEVINSLNSAARSNKPDHSSFQGAAYKRALDKIGRRKLEALFPNEVDRLYDLADASLDMTYQPPYSSVNNSNTASALINFSKAIPGGVPIVGDAVKGYANQKAAERILTPSMVSPQMRDKASADFSQSLLDSGLFEALRRGGASFGGSNTNN